MKNTLDLSAVLLTNNNFENKSELFFDHEGLLIYQPAKTNIVWTDCIYQHLYLTSKKITLLLTCAVAFIMLTSADGCEKVPAGVQGQEQQQVEANQKRLMTETEIPILTSSLDRKNISKRLLLFEDENKVSYIYLISFGKVMAFYTIKGKVTSGNKRLTTNEKIIENSSYESGNYSTVESPSLDGTYGSSSDYIFFWTTSGTYVQWSDDYMLCDQPMKLSTQPELIYDLTKK